PLSVMILGPGPKSSTDAPHSRELLWALGAGITSCIATTWWFSRFHLVGALTTADFPEYCQSVAALVWHEDFYYSRNRSLLNGVMAGLFAREAGIIDGLALSSIFHTMILGSALYLWGRALGDRLSGVSAALLMGAVAPLAVLPRTLSFYPQVVAFFALSGAAVLWAWRWPSPRSILWGSAAVGLCLATDLRGLAFGLTHGGMLLLLAAWYWWKEGRGARLFAILSAALILPIVASYAVSHRLYSDQAPGLEERMDVRKLFAERGYTDAKFQPPYDRPSRYLWGHSSILEIPTTLQWISEQSQLAPENWKKRQHNSREIGDQYDNWVWPLAVLCGVVTFVLRGQYRLLLGLTGVLVPYFAQLHTAVSLVDFHVRFLGPGMLIIPALGGVAWAGLCQLPFSPLASRRGPAWLRPTLGFALLLAVMFGLIPTWLSPVAPWRRAIMGDRQPYDLQQAATQGGMNPKLIYPCLEALKNDKDRNSEAGYRIFR
ncbi:MAG TPA: hypothetical protein PKY30_15500, partial [Myxococcota bacterium]|nr:hypothetical protein [Myxococcota bacterium]